MKHKLFILIALVLFITPSCNKYLDVIPDNIPTLDNAFTLRSTAERYLFTCYSYIPAQGDLTFDPGILAGDEFWLPERLGSQMKEVAMGFQRFTAPHGDYYGSGGVYRGIRDCNIFLENIGKVPGMRETERNQWISEALFLKAYFHFYLLRMYGPITIVKDNLPIYASAEDIKLYRSPFDEGVDYIVELLESSIPNLPKRIEKETSELGRITQAIALSLKAQLLVMAASPLFNGNPDYGNLVNNDGTPLFSPEYDLNKWVRAAQACEEAVEFVEENGYELYQYSSQFSQYALSDTIITQMSIRNSIADLTNSELIWGGYSQREYNATAYLQSVSTPRGLVPAFASTNNLTRGFLAVPLKIANTYYTENGVPLEEDRTRNMQNKLELRAGDAANRLYIKQGYVTAELNFNREPRYYAGLGFDGGIWYGQGFFNDKSDDLLFVSSKDKQPAAELTYDTYSVTGYWPKKLVHYENDIGQLRYTIENYPYPIFRLADLYLLYAEALNEAYGPSDKVYFYIDKIRERAGLRGVEYSWTNFSRNSQKHTTQIGLRSIIQQERLIELAFEGKRFWDLRRWKRAAEELNKPISGWDLKQSDAQFYYREKIIYNQTFSMKDYLWPISELELLKNENLEQNPGWPSVN